MYIDIKESDLRRDNLQKSFNVTEKQFIQKFDEIAISFTLNIAFSLFASLLRCEFTER